MFERMKETENKMHQDKMKRKAIQEIQKKKSLPINIKKKKSREDTFHK
jgi:hypothetical protein